MTPFLFYIPLSFLCFLTGMYLVVGQEKKYTWLFVLAFTLIIPDSPILKPYFAFGGIHYFDYLLVGIFLMSIVKVFITKCSISYQRLLPLFILLLLIILLLTNIYGINKIDYKLVFKDLRPWMYLVMFFYVISVNRQVYINFEKHKTFVIFLLCVSVIKAVLMSYLLSLENIDLSGVYVDTVSPKGVLERYSDTSTVTSLILFTWVLSDNKGFKGGWLILLLTAIIVIISGSRAYVLSLVLVSFMSMFNSKHNRIFNIILILSSIIGVFVIYYLRYGEVAIDLEKVLTSYISRIYPFIDYLDNTDDTGMLFGAGLGYAFYIPWFEITDLNVYAPYLDNLYLTLFAKYGLISIILFTFPLIYFYLVLPKRMFIYVSVIWCWLSMTTAIMYQLSYSAWLLIIYIIGMFSVKKKIAMNCVSKIIR